VQYKSILAMIFNEIKCHVNTSLGLLGGFIPCITPCPRQLVLLIMHCYALQNSIL